VAIKSLGILPMALQRVMGAMTTRLERDIFPRVVGLNSFIVI
jgi:hypothetical protein